jgi:hypothetical protein
LVINDANPSADAGQCPHIKRYIISGKSGRLESDRLPDRCVRDSL